MALDFYLAWQWASQLGGPAVQARKRRRPQRNFSTESAESLEARCLLSATGGRLVAADAAQVAVVEKAGQSTARIGRAAPNASFPNLAGTWEIVTHFDGLDVHGTLVLQQNGQKLVGTLTNDMQPPGEFKAKILGSKSHQTAHIKGKTVHRSFSSKKKVKVDAQAKDADHNFTFESMLGTLEGGNPPEQQPFDGTHTVFDDN